MIRNWKSASVGTTLVLAVAALSLYAYSRAHAAPTYRLANGVEVTSVDIQPSDTDRLLDAKMWKFNVSLPDAGDHYYTLYLCRRGKIVKSLAGIGIGKDPNQRPQVTFGIVPIGDTLFKASRMKYVFRVGGGDTSGTFANPFMASNGLYGSDVQVSKPDNLIYLMSGQSNEFRHGAADMNDIALALSIDSAVPKH